MALDGTTLVFIGNGLLFMILGIPLALNKIKPNSFYGFRTPKTLSDPNIWYPVNRICGIDFFIAGFIIIVGSLLFKILLKHYDPLITVYADLGLLLLALAVVVIHGFIVLNRY